MPAFRLLTLGQFTSTIGDYCYAVVLPLFVLSHHGSPASLGIVLACYGVPRALLTIPGGSLADRFGPRLVMFTSDALRCGLTAGFTVLAAEHRPSLEAVAPVAAALGACSALFLPASLTLMPSLVDRAQLASANALYSGFVQVGSMIGPLIGGILVATGGPAPAFAVDAASFLVSASCLMLIGRAVAPGPRPRKAVPAQTVPVKAVPAQTVPAQAVPAAASGGLAQTAGCGAAEPFAGSVWALLRRERLLQNVLLVSVTANFALTGIIEVTLPALTHERYGAAAYGAVLACIAVMGVAGALIVAWAGERFVRASLIAVGFEVAAVAIAVAPLLGGLTGLAISLSVFGLALGFDNAVWGTLIQRWAPPEMLGRVWGVLMLAPVCSFPLSTLIAGVLTRHLGPAPVFSIAGVLLALSYLFGLSSREFRELGRPRADPN